jgi:hypothetical protein
VDKFPAKGSGGTGDGIADGSTYESARVFRWICAIDTDAVVEEMIGIVALHHSDLGSVGSSRGFVYCRNTKIDESVVVTKNEFVREFSSYHLPTCILMS